MKIFQDRRYHGAPRGRIWRTAPWPIAAAFFALPVIAMQVTDEVAWDEIDFAIFGAMLLAACGVCEMAAGMTGNVAYRAAVGVAVVAAFILIWMNLAVGIIGSEGNPANLMYGGVLAVALLGAIAARFRSDGMARALVATALAQALTGVIAVAAGWGAGGTNRPATIMILTGIFTALWLAAAWLFRRASRLQSAAP